MIPLYSPRSETRPIIRMWDFIGNLLAMSVIAAVTIMYYRRQQRMRAGSPCVVRDYSLTCASCGKCGVVQIMQHLHARQVLQRELSKEALANA